MNVVSWKISQQALEVELLTIMDDSIVVQNKDAHYHPCPAMW